MAGATLAIMSVTGAPEALSQEFEQSLEAAATQRAIALAPRPRPGTSPAAISALRSVKDGAAVEFVWDVFTPDKQRAQRLTDTIVVRGSGDDPWSIVTPSALDSIAARSADDLAAYLSNTPGGRRGRCLSYAQ